MGDPFIGRQIWGYTIEERIAQGGMASVYAANHGELARRVAIKILAAPFSTDPTLIRRLRQEAEIVNAIRHPNLIDIFDFVELDSPRAVACVMELLPGPTLATAVRCGPLTTVQTLNVILQLSSALAAVHALGVVHRDVKPQNVILVGDRRGALDEVPSVKLLDFGIAKLPVDFGSPALTQHGRLLGTPAYMAPEQVSGRPVSPATDLYALAELLYELLTGARVFAGPAPAVMAKKLIGPPPGLIVPPALPGAARLTSLITRCLAVAPEARPSLEELQDDLQNMLQDREFVAAQSSAGSLLREALSQEVCAAEDTPTYDDDLIGGQSVLLARIMADFEDVLRSPPSVPPAPEVVLHEPKLELMTPEERRALWENRPTRVASPAPMEGPSLARVTHHLSRRSFVGPGAASASVGPPVPAPRSRSSSRAAWFGVAVAAVTSLAAFASSKSSALEKAEHLVERRRAEWAEKHGVVQDSLDTLLVRAEVARRRDVETAYRSANTELERAVLLDVRTGVALASWVENQLWWKREALTELELEELSGFTTLALFRSPKDPTVLRAAAQLALRRNELPLAASYGREAIEARPNGAEERLTQAELLAERDLGAGLDLLSAAPLAQHPRARRVEATLRLRAAYSWSARRAILTRAADLAEDGSLGLLLAEALYAGGHSAEAQRILGEAKKAPGDPSRLVALEGRILEAEGRSGRAQELYTELGADRLGATLVRAQALARAARLAANAGRHPEADALAAQALALAPDSVSAQLTRAEHALASGDAAVAATRAASVLGRADGVDAEILLSAALYARGDRQEAILVARAAAAKADQQPAALAVYGAVALLSEQPTEARRALAELLVADPGSAFSSRSEPGLSAVALGYLASSLHAHGPTVSDWAVAEALASALWSCAGRDAEAKAALLGVTDPALRAAPLAYLGHRALIRGATAEATSVMGAVFKIAPEAPAALLLAARLAERSENGPAALAFYREALRKGAVGPAPSVGAADWGWRLGTVRDPAQLRAVIQGAPELPQARLLAELAHL